MKLIDRTGQRYGHLTVIERAEDYISPKGASGVRWKCRCDCGKELIVHSTSLISGSTLSCGCYRENRLKKRNEITIIADVACVKFQDKYFLVDVDDLEIIKQDSWHIGKHGYPVRNKDKKTIHSILMNPPKGMCVDHINHNKLDNRRCNLRIVSYSTNGYNKQLKKTNTGYFFITQSKSSKYYSVTVDGKYIGGSYDIEEAIKIRDDYIPKSEVYKQSFYLQQMFGNIYQLPY